MQMLSIQLFDKYNFDGVIHLAAESHVDRSIANKPVRIYYDQRCRRKFIKCSKENGKIIFENKLFYHVSTDEVWQLRRYRFIYWKNSMTHVLPILLQKQVQTIVRAYENTYRLPIVLSNCSNNYGAYQFPEKHYHYL